MKTQLLEDIGENTNAPLPRPARRPARQPAAQPPPQAQAKAADKPGPAVWHRPQLDKQAEEPTEQRPPEPREAVAGDPEWLADYLQRAVASRDGPYWSSVWKRRAVTWSLAGVLLACAVAAGLWTAEERKVAGALAVVATTETPAAAMPAAAQPAAQIVAAPAPVPAPTLADVQPEATPSADPPERTVVPVDVDAVKDSKPPVHAPRRRRPDTVRASAEPSPEHKRAETLLQCRVYGYDERQCMRRGCAMTRFGLACRG